jgi:hypothetical protein
MRKYLPAGFLGRRSTLRTRRKETVYLSAASLRVFRLKLCDERPLALRFMFPLLCSSSATARPSNRQQVLSTARNTAGETCILGSDGCEAPRPGGRCANHLRRSAFVRLVFGRDHLRDSQKRNSRTQRSKSASLPLQTLRRAPSYCASVEPPTGAFDGEEHSRGDVHPWA